MRRWLHACDRRQRRIAARERRRAAAPAIRGDDPAHFGVRLRIVGIEHTGAGNRRRMRRFGQHAAVGLADVDFGFHRESDPQRMLGQLVVVERYAHRDALDDLDPVAGRVLRRQQRERGAGSGAEPFDLAVILHFLAVHIGAQLDRLADAQVANLAFLEIRFDPNLVERDHRHQRRAGLHALAQLHAALRDITIDRRDEVGALQREIRFVDPGSGALDVGMLIDRRAVGQHLVRGELLARRLRGRRGRGDARLCRRQLRVRVIEFLAADGAGLHQRRATRYVVFGAGDIALGLSELGLARGDLRAQRAVVRIDRAHFAHRLRELRFGLVERDPGIGRIELHHDLAGLHVVGVVGIDRGHGARHLRRDLHDVALHVCVVGRLEVIEHEPPVGAVAQAAGEDERRDCSERLAPLRIAFGRLRAFGRPGILVCCHVVSP